jgi:metacaspase-1
MTRFMNRDAKDALASTPGALPSANIRMISGCEDTQTSADVSSVDDFKLPDAAGKAGGACTRYIIEGV